MVNPMKKGTTYNNMNMDKVSTLHTKKSGSMFEENQTFNKLVLSPNQNPIETFLHVGLGNEIMDEELLQKPNETNANTTSELVAEFSRDTELAIKQSSTQNHQPSIFDSNG